MAERVMGAGGVEIEVGSTIHLHSLPNVRGEITEITDPDGDVDDWGRPYGIPPTITVRFEDGEEDTFSAVSTARWHDDDNTWECDDLVLVREPSPFRL